MKEVWKPIRGFEVLYEVSNLGRIRSLDKIVDRSTKGRFLQKGKLLTPCDRGNDYLRVCIRIKNKQTTFSVHREVAVAFLGDPPSNSHQVNHKNGNKQDNRAKNLEWVTPKENTIHAAKSGLHPRGERSGMAKLTDKKVARIRKLYSSGKYSQTKLGAMFNVSQVLVGQIVHRKIWTHVK